ncbi:hypothetical protein NEF87_000096 [Candidatus Lokiarchaeum ossiferum]|uniref:AAA+ ATPase domain-containing protein n=1 Tax=Candidatus Lokiarchaeum ossiferum TaxID=2951803 RepID=A0ABY6HJV5_9ARCH|nr:hypothetical protein NEF87_000096 [Candidatus Lokiarchaeum sp. B-35]
MDTERLFMKADQAQIYEVKNYITKYFLTKFDELDKKPDELSYKDFYDELYVKSSQEDIIADNIGFQNAPILILGYAGSGKTTTTHKILLEKKIKQIVHFCYVDFQRPEYKDRLHQYLEPLDIDGFKRDFKKIVKEEIKNQFYSNLDSFFKLSKHILNGKDFFPQKEIAFELYSKKCKTRLCENFSKCYRRNSNKVPIFEKFLFTCFRDDFYLILKKVKKNLSVKHLISGISQFSCEEGDYRKFILFFDNLDSLPLKFQRFYLQSILETHRSLDMSGYCVGTLRPESLVDSFPKKGDQIENDAHTHILYDYHLNHFEPPEEYFENLTESKLAKIKKEQYFNDKEFIAKLLFKRYRYAFISWIRNKYPFYDIKIRDFNEYNKKVDISFRFDQLFSYTKKQLPQTFNVEEFNIFLSIWNVLFLLMNKVSYLFNKERLFSILNLDIRNFNVDICNFLDYIMTSSDPKKSKKNVYQIIKKRAVKLESLIYSWISNKKNKIKIINIVDFYKYKSDKAHNCFLKYLILVYLLKKSVGDQDLDFDKTIPPLSEFTANLVQVQALVTDFAQIGFNDSEEITKSLADLCNKENGYLTTDMIEIIQENIKNQKQVIKMTDHILIMPKGYIMGFQTTHKYTIIVKSIFESMSKKYSDTDFTNIKPFHVYQDLKFLQSIANQHLDGIEAVKKTMKKTYPKDWFERYQNKFCLTHLELNRIIYSHRKYLTSVLDIDTEIESSDRAMINQLLPVFSKLESRYDLQVKNIVKGGSCRKIKLDLPTITL